MKRYGWILGLWTCVMLACGVESSPTPADNQPAVDETSSVQQDEVVPAAGSLTPDGQAAPAVACTKGRLCCPFPRGCSCDGFQECVNGQLEACTNAAPLGVDCP